VAGSFEHGDEPSGSIKVGKFPSHEGLCSMELVNSQHLFGGDEENHENHQLG
jgi:hypothetical protein